jgi:hypothetical protein
MQEQRPGIMDRYPTLFVHLPHPLLDYERYQHQLPL